MIEVRAHDLQHADLALQHLRPLRRRDARLADRLRHDVAQRSQPLGRDPRRASRPRHAHGTPAIAQRVEPAARLGRERAAQELGHQPQREQRIVQLVDIAHDRGDLFTRELDRARIQRGRDIARLDGETAAHLDRARAPLLERGIVEVRVRVRIDELVRQRARLDGIAREHLDLAALELLEDALQTFAVHRFDEAIAHRLEHERVIRHLARPDDVLATRERLREHHGQRIGRAHLDEVRRNLLAVAAAQHRQRAGDIPAPADLEHRPIEQRLREDLARLVRRHVREHRIEREAVRLAERDHDAVVGRGGLKLEIERHAKLLAQCQAPRAIDPPAERRVDHELHPAALIEEALGDDEVATGQGAERRTRRREVRDHLLGGAQWHRRARREPRRAHLIGLAAREHLIDLAAQVAHLVGELLRARRRFAEPERDARRLALRILDDDLAHLDLANPPRRVAELEDIASGAIDREVFIDRADRRLFGKLHDHVVVVIWNRTARGDRREPRTAPRAHQATDPIAMEIRAGVAAPIRDAFREHLHQLLELLVGDVGVRRGAPDQPEELDLLHLLGRADRDDLLREDIERRLAQREDIEVAALHAAHERRALDQLVARECEQAPLRRGAQGVARATDALEQRRDRARRAELDHEIDGADIDSELERGGRDRALDLTVLELLLGREAQRARHRAVMRDDVLLAEPLLERRGYALDEPPRIDEHDRRAMLRDELRDPVVHAPELLVARDRGELVIGDLDREIDLALVTAIDDVRHRPPRADQEARDHLDRTLRRGQANADRRLAAGVKHEPIQALEREREMRAALVAGDRVNLVDDDRLHPRERLATLHGGEQDEQRLGRGDQDVRRMLREPRAFADRRVAGARRDLDIGKLDAFLGGARGQLTERRFEVAMDIVRERLERRDVEDLGPRFERAFEPSPDQLIEAHQERGERLARAGRRGDQHIFARRDSRPAIELRFGRRTKALPEPTADQRMERFEAVTHRGEHTTANRRSLTTSSRWPAAEARSYPRASQARWRSARARTRGCCRGRP